MFFDRLSHFDFSLVTGEEIVMMLIGYFVVFAVLASLYFVFQNMPKLISAGGYTKSFFLNRKKNIVDVVEAAENKISRNGRKHQQQQAEEERKVVLSGEVNAAISAAIHLYVNEAHDEENTILTIDKVSRRYSPWSSKIYSVTNLRR